MTPSVSSWKTNLLLSSRTPLVFWALALLLTLILHMLLIWQFRGWLAQRPPKPQLLRVEWLVPPEMPSPQKVSVKEPIPVPPKNEEPELLNDLIQKEPSEKLSVKMLKTAKKNTVSGKSETSPGLPSEPSGIKKQSDTESKSEVSPKLLAKNHDLADPEEEDHAEEQIDLKDSLAFLPPHPSEESSSQLNPEKPDTGNLEPLPDNWMLRKTTLKAEEEIKSPGLRSLIQNAWLSESSKEEVEGPPPPPGSPGISSRGSGFYTLSSYDWPYESYMGRWAKALVYHWRNNPPMDYISRLHPQGGEVFVLASLNRSGELNAYEVTQVHQASEEMERSVVDAVLSSSQLPPLPDDHDEDLLQVHFRFIYPPLRIKNI